MSRAVLGLGLLLLLPVAATFAQITPSGDAYTNTAAPNSNFGSGATLTVSSPSQTSYIAFDLSSIPASYNGNSIANATLKLYVNNVKRAGSFNVDFVNGSWSESSLTVKSAPALGTTIAASVPLVVAQTGHYVLVDVTAAVQSWLDPGQPNNGIALVANSPLTAQFESKENANESHPPELDIVFATGPGTITGVLTGAGSGLAGGGTSGTLNLTLTSACASGQVLQWTGSAWTCATVGGTGTITGVTAGTALTGGGTSGNVTLNLNTGMVPLLNTPNTFNGNQTVHGNLSATGLVTGSAFQIGSFLFAYGNPGDQNAFLGFSGNMTMTGTDDTAAGVDSLHSNTTGYNNTAIGVDALYPNTTGYSNTASGRGALISNTTGNRNTASGDAALSLNQTGVLNTAFGYLSGSTRDFSPIVSSNNTFLGAQTAVPTGTVFNATAIGAFAEVDQSDALVLGSINGVNGATADTKVGIGTTTPQYALDVHGTGNFTTLLVNGQPIGGTGTITGVTAGIALTGGGTSGNVTLNVDTTKVVTGVAAGNGLTGGGTGGNVTLSLDTTKVVTGVSAGAGLAGGGAGGVPALTIDPTVVPLLSTGNIFSGNQTVNGNLSATGLVTGSAFQIGSNLFAYGDAANWNAFLGFAGNTTGAGGGNTATGSQALFFNNGGNSNTASGYSALYLNTTGGGNTAVGVQALGANTTGFDNTALGYGSGRATDTSALTGQWNTFLGEDAAVSTGTLTNATAVGAKAEVDENNALVLGSINGVNHATADVKVGIGTTTPQYALDVHGTGNFSNLLVNGQPVGGSGTITGVTAGPGLTGGGTSGNVTLAVDTTKVLSSVFAGMGLTGGGTGGNQTLSIDNTKIAQLGAANVFTANQSVLGSLDVSTGVSAASVNASEYSIGGQVFAYGSTAVGNSFLGFAGNVNVTNNDNTGVGMSAFLGLINGEGNTAVGNSSLAYVGNGSENTAVGIGDLSYSTGTSNTGVGARAGVFLTTGDYNTAAGFYAGTDSTAPDTSDTTTVGAFATVFQPESTAIGFNAVANAANATAIGSYSQVDEQNTLVLGSVAGINNCTPDIGCDTTKVGIGTTTPDAMLSVNGTADKVGGGSWDTYSDGRLKNVNGQFIPGLNAILKLQPIRYRYKEQNGMGIRDLREHVGFVAQDVQKVIPDAVTSNDKGYLLVNNDPIILAMLNAIKEQQREIAVLRKQAAELHAAMTQMKQSRKEGMRLASVQHVP